MRAWKWKMKHDPGVELAEQALAQAERDHELVKSRWPLIHTLTRDLADMRAENNFAARIRAAYGEGR